MWLKLIAKLLNNVCRKQLSYQEDTSEENTSENDKFKDTVRLGDEETEKLVLSEVRRRYEFEESRRESVESKTNILIGINALLASLVTVFSFALIPTLVIIAMVVVSIVLSIYVLKPRKYDVPGKENIDDFMGYVTSQKGESLMRRLIRSYIISIERNKRKGR
ncbi:hypothetical protein [Halococcus agarilyticus]|uniref:hypothetical protein n=1 Tax=Halococcus agarilyticus TaxID=1232219 RepID=UPI0012AB5549|nr:hypothetical protein [Halococcus agarilyticus]